jgi:hypothetical protein
MVDAEKLPTRDFFLYARVGIKQSIENEFAFTDRLGRLRVFAGNIWAGRWAGPWR